MSQYIKKLQASKSMHALEEKCRELGYSDPFKKIPAFVSFLEDNQGAIEAIRTWIDLNYNKINKD